MYFATKEVLWLAFCYLILLVDEFVFKWAFSCFRLFLDESESIFFAKVWTAKYEAMQARQYMYVELFGVRNGTRKFQISD